jgi:cytochrome b subunit of formate dehydrogenase
MGFLLQQTFEVPFRIDDLSVLIIIFIAIFGCAAHFLREIILGRRGKSWEMVFGRVQRYNRMQIFVHWFYLAILLVLLITGLMIYKDGFFFSIFPFLTDLGLRGLVAYHWYFMVIFIGLSLFHIIYDVFILNLFREANFTRADLKNLRVIIRNFFGLAKNYPKLEKLHPMQKMLHLAIAITLILLGVTGLTIWEPFLELTKAIGLGSLEEWLYIYDSRYLHDLFTFIFVGLMIGHFYFSTLIPANWKVFRGMTRGWIEYKEESASNETVKTD